MTPLRGMVEKFDGGSSIGRTTIEKLPQATCDLNSLGTKNSLGAGYHDARTGVQKSMGIGQRRGREAEFRAGTGHDSLMETNPIENIVARGIETFSG